MDKRRTINIDIFNIGKTIREGIGCFFVLLGGFLFTMLVVVAVVSKTIVKIIVPGFDEISADYEMLVWLFALTVTITGVEFFLFLGVLKTIGFKKDTVNEKRRKFIGGVASIIIAISPFTIAGYIISHAVLKSFIVSVKTEDGRNLQIKNARFFNEDGKPIKSFILEGQNVKHTIPFSEVKNMIMIRKTEYRGFLLGNEERSTVRISKRNGTTIEGANDKMSQLMYHTLIGTYITFFIKGEDGKGGEVLIHFDEINGVVIGE